MTGFGVDISSRKVRYWRGVWDAVRGRRSVIDPEVLITGYEKAANRSDFMGYGEVYKAAPEVIDRLDGIIEDLRAEKRYDISDRIRTARDVLKDARHGL